METFMWITCFFSLCIVGQQHTYNIEECLYQILRNADRVMKQTDISTVYDKLKILSKKKELNEDDKELLLNHCKRHGIVKRDVKVNFSNITSTDMPIPATSSVLSNSSSNSSPEISHSQTKFELNISRSEYNSDTTQFSNPTSSPFIISTSKNNPVNSFSTNVLNNSLNNMVYATTSYSTQPLKVQASTSANFLGSRIIRASSFSKVVTSISSNTTTPVLMRVETKSLVILLVVAVFSVFLCYLVAFGLHGKSHSFSLNKKTKGDLSEFDRLTSVKVPNMYGINKTDKPIDVKKNEPIAKSNEETDSKNTSSGFDNIALEQRE